MYITVDKNVTYQTFEGFGASGAWWAQAVGGWTNTDPASGMAVRDRISQLLFSREQGIGLRTYRYNIGGSVSGKGDFPNPLRRAEMFETSPGRYDFSRDAGAVYMMRGAVRVAVHTGDPALKALAFVQGENTVVLLINDMPAEKAVSFAGLGTAAQLVVTDAHVNLQQRRVNPAAVTLPAKSVCTLLFSGTA